MVPCSLKTIVVYTPDDRFAPHFLLCSLKLLGQEKQPHCESGTRKLHSRCTSSPLNNLFSVITDGEDIFKNLNIFLKQPNKQESPFPSLLHISSRAQVEQMFTLTRGCFLFHQVLSYMFVNFFSEYLRSPSICQVML